MNRIREIWTQYPFFGYRKITAYLSLAGIQVNRKRIQRLMKIMDLRAIYPGPKTRVKPPGNKVYPYLLRELDIDHPNHVWQVDSPT